MWSNDVMKDRCNPSTDHTKIPKELVVKLHGIVLMIPPCALEVGVASIRVKWLLLVFEMVRLPGFRLYLGLLSDGFLGDEK